ncbi:MAG: GH92 family glycosyl hydrolase [Oscillospiraceae bacterium]|jgi:predicted alpha-1,2-mannosidase|nr:GH92 family glycosyl hydrolase [Oscillospiraceae bacterium]
MRTSDFVNVFMGTAGSGKAIVGPQVPHGMVKLAPQTFSLPNAGYDYDDDAVLGFAHTHIEGIGGGGGRGHLMLMPATGAFVAGERAWCSPFSHRREEASVGYYGVDLLRYGVKAELAATKNCSLLRCTYPASDAARLYIDVSHTLAEYGLGVDGCIAQTAPTELRGHGVYPIDHPGSPQIQLFFCIRLSKPAENVVFWQDGERIDGATAATGAHMGASPEFRTAQGEVVYIKTGISYCSAEQAAENLERQIPSWDFDGLVERCKTAWDEALSVIEIETWDTTAKKIFYSDLYRSLNAPVDYTEEDGRYFIGADGKRNIRDAQGRVFYSDIWALWDTFRATHPLQHLVEPARQSDVAWSLMENYFVSGKLPMAPAPCLGLIPCMLGHHAASVLAESYAKGRRDFDYQAAFAAMLEATLRTDIGAEGVPVDYAEKGYVVGDGSNEDDHSVSFTLELTYDDWCTAQMARYLGDDAAYDFLSKRAQNYKNVLDPQTGFVRRKNAGGAFTEPFNPNDSHKRGFCECSPWEYTTLVPHDIQGVINLMGGDARMIEHIDGTFAHNRFNHINETAFHIPFIYNFARAPHKTMEVCRNYMPTVHSLAPGGLYGEDDSGAMSAWFVFIALGLFPSCPARPCYSLTSPAFSRWKLHLPGGKTFCVEAKNNSAQNIYIQSATLNGAAYDKSYLTHEAIFAGGRLELVMGSRSSQWATAFDSAPPSDTTQAPQFTVLDVQLPDKCNSGESATAHLKLQNSGASGSLVCQVRENGLLRGSAVCTLEAGAQGVFSVPFVLYDASTQAVAIHGVPCAVRVTQPRPAHFAFGEITTDQQMLPAGNLTEHFTVTCKIKNEGSYAATQRIACRLDGAVTERRALTLQAGEEASVTFRVKPTAPGSHYAQIGQSGLAELDVARQPEAANWILWRGCQAEFGAAGGNLYIKAAGSQHQYPASDSNQMRYGILFGRNKMEGDFDATVRVAYEQYTTPYAMHGIVIKNSLEKPWQDCGGLLYYGAMSSRGFMAKHYSENIDPESLRGNVDGPEAPYWFRVEKRGRHFDCYYSKDEQKTWVRQLGVTIEDAAREQYVGLFVNSCVPDLRLVKFSGFSVVMVRA